MRSKLVLSMLLAWGWSVCAGASEDPNRALLKQCESAEGEVKAECQEVAKDILRNDTSASERDDKTSQDVTHSSPAMTSPAESKREAANKKRKTSDKKAPDANDAKTVDPDAAE